MKAESKGDIEMEEEMKFTIDDRVIEKYSYEETELASIVTRISSLLKDLSVILIEIRPRERKIRITTSKVRE